MNDPIITRIADELQRRINEAPTPEEAKPAVKTRLEHLEDSGYSFWLPDRTNALKVGSDLEDGGYTAEKAGSDFTRVVTAALALVRGEIDGLILSGKTGCGKTTAAKVIAKCVRKVIRPDEPWFEDDTPFVEQSDAVSCSHGNLGIVTSHPVLWDLFLDDLGADRPRKDFGNESDPVADYIVKWADARKHGKLIVTTNLDAAGIKARYDDRVLSRLVEKCGWLAMEAPDHRLASLRKF